MRNGNNSAEITKQTQNRCSHLESKLLTRQRWRRNWSQNKRIGLYKANKTYGKRRTKASRALTLSLKNKETKQLKTAAKMSQRLTNDITDILECDWSLVSHITSKECTWRQEPLSGTIIRILMRIRKNYCRANLWICCKINNVKCLWREVGLFWVSCR